MASIKAVIKDGVVVNVIECDTDFTLPEAKVVLLEAGFGIGDLYDNGFVKKAIDDEIPPSYRELRKEEYPPIGDQLDAIWKDLNYRRINGNPLTQEADNVLNKILAVKAKFPKPEQSA